MIHQARSLEQVADEKVLITTTAADGSVRGGVAVIKDHAACQFRAFALHRLGAESPQSPSAGLDAAERGTLLHHVLAQIWSQLKTKSTLDIISNEDLDALLMRSANEAIAHLRRERPAALAGRLGEIERRRLMR